MNKFEMKIQKLENKLALLQWQYGANHFKVSALKKEIKLYRKVCLLSHAEAREQLSFAAGDVKYAKIIGVYPPYSYSFSANKRKLLKVLTERLKAEHKERKQDLKNNYGSVIEIGHCVDEVKGGMEIS